MDNLHVRLNFNLSKVKKRESNTEAKKNIMKLVKCIIWLRNVVKLGKYSLANFVYVCITCGNCGARAIFGTALHSACEFVCPFVCPFVSVFASIRFLNCLLKIPCTCSKFVN
jgi:hypothetical protein